jgi:hypothetical protein
MGREARCFCTWASESGQCKVLLETHELILRGDIRRRVLISSLTNIVANGDQLGFRASEDEVTLRLGAELAAKWAKGLTAPPPTLAKKLGISESSRILLIGTFDDEVLNAALAEAGVIGAKDGNLANLIIACVDTTTVLKRAINQSAAYTAQGVPLWMIYVKGPGTTLPEAVIRGTLRDLGYIDTKVASVSAKLTALRFIRRST